MVRVRSEECEGCNYYDKKSGLCGFCMMKILREIEEERSVKKDGNRQDEAESVEQTV